MRKTITLLILLLTYTIVTTTTTFAENTIPSPTINSESAILIEANSGAILYEKNAHETLYPASLTKIATAIYAIEKGQLDDIVTVSANARSTAGTRVYLEQGEQVTLLKLIQGLLINSGNDAGVAIAEHLSGSVEQFSVDLNGYLQNEIHLTNTHFVNPTGLFHPDHVTTASDLAQLTQYAARNDIFMENFGMLELPWEGESWNTTIVSHHRILNGEIPVPNVTGGKTGYVPQSRFTLATTAENEHVNLIAITLKGTKYGIYRDTKALVNFALEQFETKEIPVGSKFTNGNNTFETSNTLFYTSLINEKITTNVNNEGLLTVSDQKGNELMSAQLTKLSSPEEPLFFESKKSESILPDTEEGSSAPLVIVLLAMLSILFFSRLR